MEVVANVLDTVCTDILDDALERSYSTGRVTIRDSDLCIDVKALTWALSNMCRGGFRTAEYWNMVIFEEKQKLGNIIILITLLIFYTNSIFRPSILYHNVSFLTIRIFGSMHGKSSFFFFYFTNLFVLICFIIIIIIIYHQFSWGLSRILYNMHEVTNFYQSVTITPQLCSRLTQLLA